MCFESYVWPVAVPLVQDLLQLQVYATEVISDFLCPTHAFKHRRVTVMVATSKAWAA
jgi:hypothetical protein